MDPLLRSQKGPKELGYKGFLRQKFNRLGISIDVLVVPLQYQMLCFHSWNHLKGHKQPLKFSGF